MHGRCNGIEMCSRPVGENDRLTLVRRFFGQTKFETEKIRCSRALWYGKKMVKKCVLPNCGLRRPDVSVCRSFAAKLKKMDRFVLCKAL